MTNSISTALVCIFTLLTVSDAIADKAKAQQYLRQRDFNRAIPELEALVNAGDRWAMSRLAYLYCHGNGVRQDAEAGRILYKKADSIGELAESYMGSCGPADYDAVRQFLPQLAASDDLDYIVSVAKFLRGTSKDRQQRASFEEAMFQLSQHESKSHRGRTLLRGELIQQDDAESGGNSTSIDAPFKKSDAIALRSVYMRLSEATLNEAMALLDKGSGGPNQDKAITLLTKSSFTRTRLQLRIWLIYILSSMNLQLHGFGLGRAFVTHRPLRRNGSSSSN